MTDEFFEKLTLQTYLSGSYNTFNLKLAERGDSQGLHTNHHITPCTTHVGYAQDH